MPPPEPGAAPAAGDPQMEVEIPARSVYVGVVRMALASVARQAGLEEEKVADLGIAVSEACANLVLAADDETPSHSIKVSWIDDDGRFVVEIVGPAAGTRPARNGSGAESDRLEMSDALLHSLVHEYVLETALGGDVKARLVVLA